jgi:hypothetical protein
METTNSKITTVAFKSMEKAEGSVVKRPPLHCHSWKPLLKLLTHLASNPRLSWNFLDNLILVLPQCYFLPNWVLRQPRSTCPPKWLLPEPLQHTSVLDTRQNKPCLAFLLPDLEYRSITVFTLFIYFFETKPHLYSPGWPQTQSCLSLPSTAITDVYFTLFMNNSF